MKGGQIIGVYEDVTEDDIADYADGHEMLKILVAYDSCRKRLKRFQTRAIMFTAFFLLVDEDHNPL